MSFNRLRDYGFEWCRENLFSAEKLENYLKSDQYIRDVQSRVMYAGYSEVSSTITWWTYKTPLTTRRKLYEIILDNHPEIDIEPVFHHYLNRVAIFDWANESLEKFVEYSKIIKLITGYYFDRKILAESRSLVHTHHFDVLNQLFHIGADVNITYFGARIPYFSQVVKSSVFGKHHFVLKKLLQTDVRIEGDDKIECLLELDCARYKSIENTLIFALLIEFS